MKRITFTILSLALLITATFNASAQGQSREVSGFTSVASSGPFNVHIKINGTESVKVDVDQEFISDVETVVENGTLKIRFKDRDHGRYEHNLHKSDIYVTAKTLSGLVGAGSGTIKLEGSITGEHANVVLSGSGDITCSVKSDKLHTMISGSGSISISGNANDANIVVTGSGQVNGKDLKTQTLEAVITGSGDINVSADKSVKASITGSGNVVYTGNADVINPHYTGSGRATKAD